MKPPQNRDADCAPQALSRPRGAWHGDWLRIIGCAAVLLAAALLGAWVRLARLDNRPMHCDEANQAIKFGRLLEDQHYVYDPREHHGPSLNYLTLPVVRLLGPARLVELSEAHLRLVPALFGIALVALVCLLVRELGYLATAVAAGLTALSPAMVFYSRYYIHEMLLAVFTFGALAALCGFARAAAACSARWPEGRGVGWWLRCAPWAVGFGLSAAMMHASKETCVIALGAMLPAAVFLFRRPRAGALSQVDSPSSADSAATAGRSPKTAATSHTRPSRWTVGNAQRGRILVAAALALVVGAGLSALLFSSFGRNPRGVLDSYTTYFYYLGRASGEGTTGRHVQAWDYYFRMLFGPQRGDTEWWPDGAAAPAWLGKWPFAARLATRPLYWPELPIALLALMGLVAAVWGRGIAAARLPAARFLAAYTLLMIGVYSAVPYKTPWCVLSFLHGMILLAGIGAGALWAGFTRPAADRSDARGGLRESRNAFPPVATVARRWMSLFVGRRSARAAPRSGERGYDGGAAAPRSGERGYHCETTGRPSEAWHVWLWRWTCRLSAGVLLAGSACWLGWQTWVTAFRGYEDPANPFVYSHTTSEVLDLVQRVEHFAAAQPQGRRTHIQVICPNDDYWPLPWYLRGFERVAWLDRPPEGPPAPLIITQPELEPALVEYLYEEQPPGRRRLYLRMLRDEGRAWQLRPYVPLEIFLRLDARDRYLRWLGEQAVGQAQ